ncbi:MAG TPA: oligosaccharide flippase family protein [Gemmatimonadales bacterium]|nr:oligosaccharide flippase family protein [Gemmatimonadales bacterium]HRZ57860.1 oligosaccharide flippase family protein [Candidatus Paceibacterota bacterium]
MFWTLTGTGLSRGSIIVANIFVGRHVSQAAFGALGVIQSTVMMFAVFAGFGIGMATTKYIAELRAERPEAIGALLGVSHVSAIGIGLLLGTSLFLLSPFIARRVFGEASLEPLLRLSALLVALTAMNAVQTSALIGFEAWASVAKLGAVSGIATLAFMIPATKWYGETGAILGLTLAVGTTAAITHLVLRRINVHASASASWRFTRSDFHLPTSFGLPVLLGSLVFSLADWAAPAILVRQPGGLEEMALINAANQWMALMVFFPVVIGRTWMPAMSMSLINGDRHRLSQLTRRAVIVTAAATVPLLVVFGLYAPQVMGLYGTVYSSSGPILVIVLLSGTVMALGKPAEYLVYAAGAVWPNLVTCSLYAAVFVSGTALLSADGARGLVLARLAGMVVQAVFLIWLARTIVSRRSLGPRITRSGV